MNDENKKKESKEEMDDLLTPVAEKKRQKNVEELMKSAKYKELKQKFNKLIAENLKKYKSKNDLLIEYHMPFSDIKECHPMKRLIILLKAHQALMDTKLWRKVPIQPLVDHNGLYGYQQGNSAHI